MPQMAAGAIEVNGGGLAVAKEHSILAYRIPLAEPCEHVLGRGGGYSRHRAIIPRFRAACVCAAAWRLFAPTMAVSHPLVLPVFMLCPTSRPRAAIRRTM
jgi:hypothetical protein